MIAWGILGAGNIAGALVDAIRATGEGEVKAIASRSADRAAAFAERFEISDAHGSYGALLDDSGLDAVYVATTNDLHHRNTLDAIAAGKAVLCEKPFALNVAQAEEMISAARAADVFLMEAMWMRFIPAIEELLRMAESGELGELRAVLANFGFAAHAGSGHRLVEPSLGGGALLDLGVYPISLAMLLLGRPTGTVAQAAIGPSGVDQQVGVSLRFEAGAVASLFASFVTESPIDAHVLGTEARVRLSSPFHHTQRLEVTGPSGSKTVDLPYDGNGYQFEVAEVHEALRAGDTESRKRPLAETLAVMVVLDEVRDQINLRYPEE